MRFRREIGSDEQNGVEINMTFGTLVMYSAAKKRIKDRRVNIKSGTSRHL